MQGDLLDAEEQKKESGQDRKKEILCVLPETRSFSREEIKISYGKVSLAARSKSGRGLRRVLVDFNPLNFNGIKACSSNW